MAFLMVLCFCCYAWSVHPVRKVLRKRVFGGLSPFLCCPEKWSGLNWTSHLHWVKICVVHNGQINLRAKQKRKVLSATMVIGTYYSFCLLNFSLVFSSLDLQLWVLSFLCNHILVTMLIKHYAS